MHSYLNSFADLLELCYNFSQIIFTFRLEVDARLSLFTVRLV